MIKAIFGALLILIGGLLILWTIIMLPSEGANLFSTRFFTSAGFIDDDWLLLIGIHLGYILLIIIGVLLIKGSSYYKNG